VLKLTMMMTMMKTIKYVIYDMEHIRVSDKADLSKKTLHVEDLKE